MDKNSKLLLNYLIENGGCRKSVYFNDFEDFSASLNMNEDDLLANIRFLHESGYLDYQKYANSDRNAAFSLSYKGLHWKYFRRQDIIRYLEDKWIDFFAMLMSLVSIVLSIIAISG